MSARAPSITFHLVDGELVIDLRNLPKANSTIMLSEAHREEIQAFLELGEHNDKLEFTMSLRTEKTLESLNPTTPNPHP